MINYDYTLCFEAATSMFGLLSNALHILSPLRYLTISSSKPHQNANFQDERHCTAIKEDGIFWGGVRKFNSHFFLFLFVFLDILKTDIMWKYH